MIYAPVQYFNDPFKSYHSENLLWFFKFSKSPHLISIIFITHHESSAVTRDSRKYNYILIRFDINYSQIVFGGKNYYDFADSKTLQFNSFNMKASFTMKLYRYNVNEKCFPIKYLMRGISV